MISLKKILLEYNDDSLWRNTNEKFLIFLLKNKTIEAKPNRYISLSMVSDSGGQEIFGYTRIEFSEEEILKQGGIFVDYEDLNFFKKFPDIAEYVTGFSNASDYYGQLGVENEEEAYKEGELSWQEFILSFEHEQEVVIKKLIFNDKLIKSVSGEISDELADLLDKNKILIHDIE